MAAIAVIAIMLLLLVGTVFAAPRAAEYSQVSEIDIIGNTYVPVPAEGSKSVAYKAVVKDRNGAILADESVCWRVAYQPQGVSVDAATGVLTVTGEAVDDFVTLIAVAKSNGRIFATRKVFLAPFPCIKGCVVSDRGGVTMQGVLVSLYDGEGFLAKVTTDENGLFEFAGLLPEFYTLQAAVQGFVCTAYIHVTAGTAEAVLRFAPVVR